MANGIKSMCVLPIHFSSSAIKWSNSSHLIVQCEVFGLINNRKLLIEACECNKKRTHFHFLLLFLSLLRMKRKKVVWKKWRGKKKFWCSENEKGNTRKAAVKWEDKEEKKKQQQQQLANEEEMNHFGFVWELHRVRIEKLSLEVNASAWCERASEWHWCERDRFGKVSSKPIFNELKMRCWCERWSGFFFLFFFSFHAYWYGSIFYPRTQTMAINTVSHTRISSLFGCASMTKDTLFRWSNTYKRAYMHEKRTEEKSIGVQFKPKPKIFLCATRHV